MNNVLSLFQSNKMGVTQEEVDVFVTKAYNENPEACVRTIFHIRDIRSGQGYRDYFRKAMVTLSKLNEKVSIQLLEKVAEYGRYDDLIYISGNKNIEAKALSIYSRELLAGNTMAAKWTPRESSKNNNKKFFAKRLRNYMKLDAKSFRKLVSGLTNVAEQKMAANKWNDIEYEGLPSICLARSMNAFTKHDKERINDYLSKVKSGDANINTSTLDPIGVFMQRETLDSDIIQVFWDNLENTIPEGVSVLSIIDTSGSMDEDVPNTNYTALDVALSFGSYVATKSTGIWKNMFVNYDDNARLHYIPNDMPIKDVFDFVESTDWGGGTSIESSINSIISFLKDNNLDDVPDYLVIFSDMELNGDIRIEDAPALMKKMFTDAGFNKVPVIVNWNICGDSMPNADVGNGFINVTGFGKNTLTTILTSPSDITPMNMMKETIYNGRYDSLLDWKTL